MRAAAARRISADRDVLSVTTGWALLPTVILALASIFHPIYTVRYVAASAPGLALLVSFVCVRVFPMTLDRARLSDQELSKRPNRAIPVFCAVAVVALVIGSVTAASALQEDLKSPPRYVAEHAQAGDVLALPDHAVTAAVINYLAGDAQRIPLWPQEGTQQPYVEGLDLSLHPAQTDYLPRRVWLIDDGTVGGLRRFQDALIEHSYHLISETEFNGATVLMYETWASRTNW
jgi:hypothetical protein